VNSGEHMIRANGVDLCVQTFGQRADPAILLIGGMAASMDWWEDEFCERLAAGSRWVIRYDHRDTGRSVTYEPGDPRYTGQDLLDDAVGVLDAQGLATGHLVGISMGGAMAQLVALDHPDRVVSLTLISTSPGPGDPDLPPASEELRAAWREPPPHPDWSDRAAVIDYIVEGERVYAARSRPFDEEAVRRIAERVVDRTVNIESSIKNHSLIDGGQPRRARLGGAGADARDPRDGGPPIPLRSCTGPRSGDPRRPAPPYGADRARTSSGCLGSGGPRHPQPHRRRRTMTTPGRHRQSPSLP
jgi:pimeloyl-ACP methyl ester carboxylesterase